MERNKAIDYIKFFAILAVVIIHTFPIDGEVVLFILDNFARFAVPFFFTASGYLFGLKMLTTKYSWTYTLKYIVKLIKIYVCWFIFYALYDLFIIYEKGGNVSKEISSYFEKLTLKNVFYYGEGTSAYQLWFLTALIWSTLIVYMFVKVKKLYVLLPISFLLYIAGLFGQSYALFYKVSVSTRDALFFGLFYTTLGCFFALHPGLSAPRPISSSIYRTFFFLFILLQATEAYVLRYVLHAPFGEYFLSTFFLTFCLFSFALSYPQYGRGSLFAKVGANALGIYVIHVFFIRILDFLLKMIGIESLEGHLLLNIVYTLFIFVFSYITYAGLQKTKKAVNLKNS